MLRMTSKRKASSHRNAKFIGGRGCESDETLPRRGWPRFSSNCSARGTREVAGNCSASWSTSSSGFLARKVIPHSRHQQVGKSCGERRRGLDRELVASKWNQYGSGRVRCERERWRGCQRVLSVAVRAKPHFSPGALDRTGGADSLAAISSRIRPCGSATGAALIHEVSQPAPCRCPSPGFRAGGFGWVAHHLVAKAINFGGLGAEPPRC